MQATKGSDAKLARTSSAAAADQENLTTLYFGNLHPAVTVTDLQQICSFFGTVEQVKVIKDKTTGTSAGYGFVKFVDRRVADAALHNLQAKLLYNQEIRVNWAFQSHQREDTSTHHHIFVGDIGQEVTDAVLLGAFSTQFPSCSDARVMWDHNTGRSKGYGFVSFRTKEDADLAIQKMQGQFIGSRRVRCGWAQHKQDDSQPPPDYENIDRADPLNTNVYVGNIAPEWSEQEVQKQFTSFGTVVEVKLHKKGGYGFVRFEKHESAVRAIVQMHGFEMGGRTLKCAWGKNTGSSSGGSQSGGMGPGSVQQFVQPPPPHMQVLMNPMAQLSGILPQQGIMPGMVMQSPPLGTPLGMMMPGQGPTHPMTPPLARQHSMPMDPHTMYYPTGMYYPTH